jgi:NAD(P)-dependent dehydrogenase (short-subunit alcohol dehydrogenase family)
MVSLGNVLITGTSTGIGKATALHLDKLGYRVFASIRNESDADALRAQAPERLTPFFLDVTDAESILKAKHEISTLVGEQGLSGVVNNAGVSFATPLEFVDLDSLRLLFEVNVFGLLAITKAMLPLVRKAHGKIINVSSDSTFVVAPFHGPYSASKLAVNGFSDALRRELAPFGVQVSVIIAGSIDTPIWEKAAKLTVQTMRHQASEVDALYGKSFKKLAEVFMQIGRHGITPNSVARVIASALAAKQARHYYLVGRDAHFLSIIKSVTPEAWKDRMVFRYFGIKG